MIKIKKINKKIFHSFIQGRFSSEVAGNYQYFPIDNWHKEFTLAKKLGFDSVEWIISDLSNPIFNHLSLRQIKKLLKKNNIKVSSISMDLIMDNPLHEITNKEVNWLSNKLKEAIKFLDIKRISFPIEERSRFNNKIERNLSLKKLLIFYKKLNSFCKICIETDISPKSLVPIFGQKKFNNLGLVLDLGNTRAHGFDIEEYFKFFSKKIYSIHVKFRKKSFGKTTYLIKKNFNELNYFIKNINKLIY